MDLVQRLETLSQEFDERAYDRHVEGASQYGAIKFLGADLVEELSQELLDISNYAKYLYIKLHIFQEMIRESSTNPPTDGTVDFDTAFNAVSPAASAFIPAGSLSDVLQRLRGLDNPG